MRRAFLFRPAGPRRGSAARIVAVLGVLVLSIGTLASLAGIAVAEEERQGPEASALQRPVATAPEAARPPEGGTMEWALRALGPFYGIVFLGLGLLLVALLVLNLAAVRRENVVPGSLVERFEKLLEGRQYQQAYETAQGDESFLGRVLSAALARLSFGYDQAVEAMQEAAEDENMRMEHRLSYLALVGTIAPMIGLLGTVHGMIASFTVIAFSPHTPRPWQLAAGISTALFTTLVGLAIAIPAIAAYNILRNRTARLALEVGILSEGLMLRFSRVGRTGKVTTSR